MAREVWGTFAVNDHCVPRAFVADVMLYDRLVIPIPPDHPTADDQKLWKKYDRGRQERLLKILGDRARTVKWDQQQRKAWKERYEAAKTVAGATSGLAFKMSRTQLTMGLPSTVTGVEAVSSYRSYEEVVDEIKIKESNGNVRLKPGAVTAVLGREFLMVDDPRMSDEAALKEAVALSSDSTYCRKRANYWRWQREFLNYEVFTDESALQAAVEEMRQLVDEQNAALRREKIKLISRYAFLVGSITLGLMTGPMLPIAITPLALALDKAFLSIGQFASERALEEKGDDRRQGAAVFSDFQRRFGWRQKPGAAPKKKR